MGLIPNPRGLLDRTRMGLTTPEAAEKGACWEKCHSHPRYSCLLGHMPRKQDS